MICSGQSAWLMLKLLNRCMPDRETLWCPACRTVNDPYHQGCIALPLHCLLADPSRGLHTLHHISTRLPWFASELAWAREGGQLLLPLNCMLVGGALALLGGWYELQAPGRP